MALAVLKDDKKAFYENVAEAAKKGEIDKLEFNIYAIYREFAGDDDFITKLDEAFK